MNTYEEKQNEWEMRKDLGQCALDVGSYVRVAKMTKDSIANIPKSAIFNDIDG